MKSKLKSNKIHQKIEENYIESHPFSPSILDDSKINTNLNFTNLNNSKNSNYKKILEESGNNIKKIPVYEKLYR